MGFFKDFKEDLSQAVNDLVTEPENASTGVDESIANEDVMVNTLDDAAIAEMSASIEKEANSELEMDIADSIKEETMSETNVNEEISEAAKDIAAAAEQESQDDILDETALITEGVLVNGDIESKGSIEILGNVVGNITCKGKITVSGSITGNSKASEIFANNAHIDGGFEASGSIKIGQGTVVVGDVAATSAVIAGAVKGNIDVHGPIIIDASAVIVGDIKSKSVQINNGATIEGRCSQCYAEVNTTSIFEKK